MSREKFPRCIWVSHASAQQSLVESVAGYIEVKNRTEPDHWYLQAYLRHTSGLVIEEPGEQDLTDIDNNNRETTKDKEYLEFSRRFLSSGEPVRVVVEAIASSLRRVIILSPEYIKSDYCLWELYACIVYGNNNIYIVLDKIDNFSLFSSSGSLEYSNGAANLAQALSLIYQQKHSGMLDCFHINNEDDLENFFQTALVELSQRVYSKSDESVESIALSIFEFARKISTQARIDDFQKCFEEFFTQWKMKAKEVGLLARGIQMYGNDDFLAFSSLKKLNISKLTNWIDTFIAQYESNSHNLKLVASIQDFASILSLLRIDPEWIGEMIDANPGTQFLRFGIPSYLDYSYRRVYEASVAACAIQGVPPKLAPGKENIPEQANMISIEPPPQPFGINTDYAKALLKEIVARVTLKNEAEVEQYMGTEDWKSRFRAMINRRYSDDKGLLKSARFLVEQSRFTQKKNSAWHKVVSQLVSALNDGATESSKINIGVLQLVDKGDCDIVHVSQHAELQDAVDELMECI